jgi:ribosomal peptide maturation radical SAM protein 1
MSDIYIVSPPFSPIEWPSLGIGQLVASAKHAGLDAKAIYLSLRFMKRIGYSLYSFIIGPVKSETLLGEWVFSNAAFDGSHLSCSKYPMHTITGNSLTANIMRLYAKKDPNFWETFKKLPRIAEKFIKDSAQEITRENPRIVGCSTSFQQYNASLALLRHIKRLNPDVITILGGANCEAEIGYITLKNFSWIDFVVSGEADSLFPKLCHTIYKYGTKIPLEKLPYGVYSREKFSAALATSNNGLRSISETAIEHNLDNIPIPDYSDYFEELQRIKLNQEFKPLLIMETSRGCWKGSRKPCNFCGLNGMCL